MPDSVSHASSFSRHARRRSVVSGSRLMVLMPLFVLGARSSPSAVYCCTTRRMPLERSMLRQFSPRISPRRIPVARARRKAMSRDCSKIGQRLLSKLPSAISCSRCSISFNSRRAPSASSTYRLRCGTGGMSMRSHGFASRYSKRTASLSIWLSLRSVTWTMVCE